MAQVNGLFAESRGTGPASAVRPDLVLVHVVSEMNHQVEVLDQHGSRVVGSYIASAYWFTSSTSFANLAVTLARAATNTFSGIHPANVAGFVLTQGLGAVVRRGRRLVDGKSAG